MLRRKVVVSGLKEEVERLRKSRLGVILLVYFALVVDNMLLTVVVPIIPDYLYQMEIQTEKMHGESQHEPPMHPTAMEFRAPHKERRLSPEDASQNVNKHNFSGAEMLKNLPNPERSTKTAMESKSVTEISSVRAPITNQMGKDFGRSMLATRSYLTKRSELVYSTKHKLQLYSNLNNRKSRYHRRRERDNSQPGDVTTKINSDQDHFDIDSSKRETRDSHSSPYTIYPGITEEVRRKSDISLSSETFRRLLSSSNTIEKPSVVRDSHPNSPTVEVHSFPEMIPRSNATELSSTLVHQTIGHLPENMVLTVTNYSEDNQDIILSNESLQSNKLPQDIINENGRVGLLFSSKAFVQLIVNPFIGPLTSRVGYSIPLLVGTHNLILSALLFAYAESYTLLFVARSIQGIASSCIAISGMGMIAECYPEDKERGRMQGMVMGGIALGVLAGYPLGGLLYDFTNSKAPPFLLIAALAAVLALVQLAVLNPRPAPESLVVATPIGGLIRDPYILVTAGAVMVSTSAMAVIEPCLPIWLTETLHPKKWQLGTAFIPDSVGYLVGTSCTAGPAYKIGRWRAAVIAMIMVAFAAATVPEAGSMLALAGPHLILGMGVGTIDAALMPLLASIVDARHVAAYGAVYAIAQGAVALAYGFGPLVGGTVVRHIGFPWLMRGVAILNLCYCPLLLTLTTLTHDEEETQAILMAAPDPHDYNRHTTSIVQPKEASLRYQQLFDEEED